SKEALRMKLVVALAPLAALVFAAGCSSDENNPGTPTQTTTYKRAPPVSIGAVPTVVASRPVTAPPTPAPPRTGTRENPIPVGTAVQVKDGWSLNVLEAQTEERA